MGGRWEVWRDEGGGGYAVPGAGGSPRRRGWGGENRAGREPRNGAGEQRGSGVGVGGGLQGYRGRGREEGELGRRGSECNLGST